MSATADEFRPAALPRRLRSAPASPGRGARRPWHSRCTGSGAPPIARRREGHSPPKGGLRKTSGLTARSLRQRSCRGGPEHRARERAAQEDEPREETVALRPQASSNLPELLTRPPCRERVAQFGGCMTNAKRGRGWRHGFYVLCRRSAGIRTLRLRRQRHERQYVGRSRGARLDDDAEHGTRSELIGRQRRSTGSSTSTGKTGSSSTGSTPPTASAEQHHDQLDAADGEYQRLAAHQSRRLQHPLRNLVEQPRRRRSSIANAGIATYVVEQPDTGQVLLRGRGGEFRRHGEPAFRPGQRDGNRLMIVGRRPLYGSAWVPD